jgi:hypothetical protein
MHLSIFRRNNIPSSSGFKRVRWGLSLVMQLVAKYAPFFRATTGILFYVTGRKQNCKTIGHLKSQKCCSWLFFSQFLFCPATETNNVTLKRAPSVFTVPIGSDRAPFPLPLHYVWVMALHSTRLCNILTMAHDWRDRQFPRSRTLAFIRA